MSSAMVDSAPRTIQERSAEATRQLCQALDVGIIKPADLKYLTLALAEVAADMARRDTAFAAKIRSAYAAVLPVKQPKIVKRQGATSDRNSKPAKTATTVKRSAKRDDGLVPIGQVDEALLDPYGPVNPYALQALYGDHQLSRALKRYSATELKDAVLAVQQNHPGTRPKSMTAKAALIDYIVEHVAGASS